jgi:hypothetical protein
MKNPLPIILLNGPPGCGKDTVADILDKGGYLHMKFAGPLKKAASVLTGLTTEQIEDLKDYRPAPGVSTLREFLISLSENCVKPSYGKTHFGFLAAKHVLRAMEDPLLSVAYRGVCFSDSGFKEELSGLLDFLKESKVVCYPQIWHIYRPDTSFDGDSRSWVTLEGVEMRKINNTGTIEDLKKRVTGNLGVIHAV